MKEQQHIRNYQFTVLIASVMLITLLVVAWIRSGPGQEWRGVQKEYAMIIEGMADTLPDFPLAGSESGIFQLELADLNRTDRCITCHMGIENPYLTNAALPHAAHSGDYLVNHPPEKYGCTICHGGQGRALNKRDALGKDPEAHWTEAVLEQPYLQASCGKCHLSIYNTNNELAGTDLFQKGSEIFKREGCLGCHKARGLGGIVGPDLTEQGEKTRHDYSFQYVSGEQTVSNWLKEHFKDPEMISPGSQMLKIDLADEDIEALITFVLGLAKPEISFEYFSLEALNEFKGKRRNLSGKEHYALSCAACHGKEGTGKSYEEYETGVPGIMNPDFRRVASWDFIQFTLQKGRSKRQMASWMTTVSGMRVEEIDYLATKLKHGDAGAYRIFDPEQLRKSDGHAGEAIFNENCATCHGESGKGGIALALNRDDMLSAASNVYLFSTIEKGRGNTAMPSWSTLPKEDIYVLVKYLRSWGSYVPRLGSISFGDSDPVDGALRFHFLCSRCHGESGQGQTGPSIINKDFMEAATDAYLYQTIASGREHSAMFGWSKDVYNKERLERNDIGNIVAYLRHESSQKPDYIFAGSNPGEKIAGRILFEDNCSKCHGMQGEGVKAPALNNQEFLNAASNGYLQATITLGRRETKMPRWGKEAVDHQALSGKERQDIIAYIRSWQRIRIKN